MLEITPFKTSLFMGDINGSGDVESHILSLKDKTSSVVKSNRGGWQSPSYSTPHDFMLDIVNQLGNHVYELYDRYGINSDTVVMKNYWFNINDKHSYNLAHTHPGSFFSAVWYVKTNKNSGDIVFKRPDLMEDYWDVNTNEHNYAEWRFTPRNNMFFIFPSYISHYVESNKSDEDRISVAFNFGK